MDKSDVKFSGKLEGILLLVCFCWFLNICHRAEVLNWWITTPWGPYTLSHGSQIRYPEYSDILQFITAAKLQIQKKFGRSNKNILIQFLPKTWTVLTSYSLGKVGKHCCRGFLWSPERHQRGWGQTLYYANSCKDTPVPFPGFQGVRRLIGFIRQNMARISCATGIEPASQSVKGLLHHSTLLSTF